MTTQVVCGCDRPSPPEGGREGGSGAATRAGWEEPGPGGGTKWGSPADRGEGDLQALGESGSHTQSLDSELAPEARVAWETWKP